ncbi:hypothetical protein VQL36_14640 [Chengkuizengella sp. SCS-71B]|uniref:hypothetical protein n=1 Tax=Chengkuizengella sp. SCS-71B TaxID=3115290 RepID=UPI0032C24B95
MKLGVIEKQRTMEQEWESWQYLLKDDLERLDHRIQAVYRSMSVNRVDRKAREEFVIGKLKGLILEISREG